jgi:hypothetical protein
LDNIKQNKNEDGIYFYTNLDQDERKKLIRYFARLPETFQVKIYDIAAELEFQNKNLYKNTDKNSFRFGMFILAINKYKHLPEGKTKRDLKLNANDFNRLLKINIEQAKKRKTKTPEKEKQVLTKYYHLIKNLREKEKLSWRQIEKVLSLQYNANISFSYIRKIYNKRIIKK